MEKNVEGVNCPFGSSSRKSLQEVDSKARPKAYTIYLVFIILYLYSPMTLAGGKMKAGLREKLGNVLGIKEKTVVSNNINGIVFSYQLYKYFRQDIERIFSEISVRLGKTK